MGRPAGSKNRMTNEHISAARELSAEYGDAPEDLYKKRGLLAGDL